MHVLRGEEGQGLTEYGFTIVVIAIVIVLILAVLGLSVLDLWDDAAQALLAVFGGG